jgi:hypothetical protein
LRTWHKRLLRIDNGCRGFFVQGAATIAIEPDALEGRAVECLDHDDFGLTQSKIMIVIDSKSLERDAGGKPFPLFLIPL